MFHQSFWNWEICMLKTFLIPAVSKANSTAGTSSGKTKKESMDTLPFPTSISHTLPQVSLMYPNVKALLLVLCTVPVTSCTAKRSFSGLKRVKTSLGSMMGNQRMSSLSLLHVHQDIDINIEEVIEEFARRHPRRLQLANILSD